MEKWAEGSPIERRKQHLKSVTTTGEILGSHASQNLRCRQPALFEDGLFGDLNGHSLFGTTCQSAWSMINRWLKNSPLKPGIEPSSL